MQQNVIIIPEQHLWHKSINTVPNMVEDNNEIIEDILTIVDKYENPIVIFDGDIFHREVKSTDSAVPLLSFFIKLHSLTNGNVYSVLGNHELTYRRNNLFWGITDVDTKYYESRVEAPLIKSVDELYIGDTLFIFGHYHIGMRNYVPSKEYNHAVLITHNEAVNDELLDALTGRNLDFNTTFIHGSLEEYIPKIPNLDYVFVGHMHQAHGKYSISEDGIECIIHYLASLGRTNHTEYTADIKRELPVITIEDDKFSRVSYETVVLKERYLAVDEEHVRISKEEYERDKEIRELRSTKTYSDDCVAGLKEIFNINPQACYIIDCALNGTIPEDVLEIMKTYDRE
jgi:DNA repair exonuclease SbcCD nuclease subunit